MPGQMKSTLFTLIAALLTVELIAQVTITNDTSYNVTDQSAILELKSNSGGLLLPRMSTVEQRLVQDPATGLLVFNTDSADLYCFNGTIWKSIMEDPPDTITTCPDNVDYGGQWYTVKLIGDQCWLAENLNIGSLINGTQEQTENSTIEKYCYNDEEDSCDVYGGLYQWDEMMQYVAQEGAQGICPPGWQIPTDGEWKILEGTVDTQYPVGDPEWDNTGNRGFDVGKRLKSTSGWSNDGNGTDAFGFTALPAGNRLPVGSFNYLITDGGWWSSTEYNSLNAWFRSLNYLYDNVNRYSGQKTYGISVRCIRR